MAKAFRNISKEEFEAYERVRESSPPTMWRREFLALTGMSQDTYIAIITHYRRLVAKYPGVRKED